MPIPSVKPRFNLPLLVKELVEQAARKRTYVLRVLYALGLFLLAGAALQDMLNTSGGNYLNMLGRGSQVFQMVMLVEIAGIYLFLPALMANALTQEKERDSLVLLLLTDLRPWEIIFQKYFGRLIPMGTFVLLALPVMAVAFSFGGIELTDVATWSWILLLTMLQVGAAALACSAFCRSTASAFVLTYLLLGALYAGPVLVAGIFALAAFILADDATARMGNEDIVAMLMSFCPTAMPLIIDEVRWLDRMARSSWGFVAAWAIMSVPSVLSIPALLWLARIWLIKRAFLPPANFVMQVFRLFDTWMNQANRLTGGVVLIPDRHTLPTDKPVAWLEVAKRATGKARYLIRVLALTYIPVLFVTTLVLAYRRSGAQSAELSVMIMIMWAVAVLLLAMQGSSAISGERRRQTLDVLLTTPMSGQEIVKQKMAPIWRLILVMLIPFLTLIFVEAWWESDITQRRVTGWETITDVPLYLFCAIASLVVYLPLIAYVAMLAGMRIANQTRAILTTMGIILGWVFGPIFVLILCEMFGWLFTMDPRFAYGIFVSPAAVLIYNETSSWEHLAPNYAVTHPYLLVIANFTIYGGIAVALRFWCLRQADRLLGRPKTDGSVV